VSADTERFGIRHRRGDVDGLAEVCVRRRFLLARTQGDDRLDHGGALTTVARRRCSRWAAVPVFPSLVVTTTSAGPAACAAVVAVIVDPLLT
jgi:hypothetical protein